MMAHNLKGNASHAFVTQNTRWNHEMNYDRRFASDLHQICNRFATDLQGAELGDEIFRMLFTIGCTSFFCAGSALQCRLHRRREPADSTVARFRDSAVSLASSRSRDTFNLVCKHNLKRSIFELKIIKHIY